MPEGAKADGSRELDKGELTYAFSTLLPILVILSDMVDMVAVLASEIEGTRRVEEVLDLA